MAWVKLDDQRAMNLKLRKAGFAARGLDEAGMCQVSADGTDGFISAHSVETLATAHRCRDWRKLVALLVEVGRWEPAVRDGEAGWEIHDYLKYNPSKAEWESMRENKRAAGRKGGMARVQADAQARASADASAGAVASAQAVPSRPVYVLHPPPHSRVWVANGREEEDEEAS